MKITAATLALAAMIAACGGGNASDAATPPPAAVPAPAPAPAPSAVWSPVTAAIDQASAQFANGLTVEIATPAGVVYSYTVGAFTNTVNDGIASGSKWVTATTLLQLVNAGVLDLDEPMSAILRDRNGAPWSGNMGAITLRKLLSFISGISGDVASSDDPAITLDEAANRIYDDQAASAQPPGSTFYYGNTHMRIAGRVAEVKTGKTWQQIFDEQMGIGNSVLPDYQWAI